MDELRRVGFLRLSPRVALALLCLAPVAALAADLGRLVVLSGVGEPLRAEVEVIAVGANEAGALRARIPPSDVFWRANLEPPPNLDAFRAGVESRPGRRYIVALRSSTPIENPFVQLLVQLESPSGTVVREYPFLLEERGAQVARPPAVPRAETPAPAAAVPAPRQGEGARVTSPRSSVPVQGAYIVKPGDTLGAIARAAAPVGATVEQTIVALHRGNPDAFEGGNMNRLRAGATLMIPTAEAATAIAQPDAVRAIQAQQVEKSGGSPPAGKAGTAAPGRDRLQLTGPDDPASTDPRGGGASADDVAALQRALADAQERITLLERALRNTAGTDGVRDRTVVPPSEGGTPRALTVPAPTGLALARSEVRTFLEDFGGLLLGLFVVTYVSWILMPIKTVRVWRAHRRRQRRRLEAALQARTRRRRPR